MKFILVLTIALAAHAADSREAEVLAAQDAFLRCWDARDVACLSKIVTDDFILFNRFEPFDREAFLKGMSAGIFPHTPPDVKTRDLKIRFYGTTAIRTQIQNQPTPIGPRGAPNRATVAADRFNTAVFVNVDGKGWRLASMHISQPQEYTPPAK
jgi:hypothetical protein